LIDSLIAIEFDGDKECPSETSEDFPVIRRKRCNTMPGTFTVPDDMVRDDSDVDEGECYAQDSAAYTADCVDPRVGWIWLGSRGSRMQNYRIWLRFGSKAVSIQIPIFYLDVSSTNTKMQPLPLIAKR